MGPAGFRKPAFYDPAFGAVNRGAGGGTARRAEAEARQALMRSVAKPSQILLFTVPKWNRNGCGLAARGGAGYRTVTNKSGAHLC
jgi:hypothetical protein